MQNKRILGTLRELLPNITPAQWAAANSTEGGGNADAQQAIWQAVQQNLNGGWGSAGQYTGMGDEYYTGEQGAYGAFDPANRVNMPDGYYSTMQNDGSNPITRGRGDYDQYVPDLGSLAYDDVAGLVNNQDIVAGSRVGRSFDNFSNAVNAGIAAIGAGALYSGLNGVGASGLEGGGGGAGYGVNTGIGPSGMGGGGAGYGVNTGVTFTGPGAAGVLGSGLGLGQIVQLGTGISGLVGGLGGGRKPPAGDGGGGGDKGGAGGPAPAFSVQRPEYIPNSYTAAQLAGRR